MHFDPEDERIKSKGKYSDEDRRTIMFFLSGRDLAEWLKRLTDNGKFYDTVESEGRQIMHF
jgi:hypothetical protein